MRGDQKEFVMQNEETQTENQIGRDALKAWKNTISQNSYLIDQDFQHSIEYYFGNNSAKLGKELEQFAEKIINEVDPLVIENNLSQNLPRIDHYDGIGQCIELIIHHPNYITAGNIIYSSRLLERMSKPGGLLEALTFMFISSQAGEAGHNCPIACSAGIIRVLQKINDFPQKDFYLQKLIAPSFTDNYTGAQFLTEIQGGSDVGRNATIAYQDEQKQWRIRGEKWFCSNANADLILMTARYDKSLTGTKGLGLFLIPAILPTGEENNYSLRRLKDKIGTRSMASAEIDFHDAYAIAMGLPEQGFKMVMENVLHISRLFNTFCMLAMARRAYFIAYAYAQHRIAFDHPIIHYPLIKENLARIKSENSAILAAICATVQLQDEYDMGKKQGDEFKLLLRLLANLNKYISALWSVDHIHHCLDVLAGNGAIESFSIIPRLFRDSIVCENWEGTHNTLRMQILRDILKYHIEKIYYHYIEDILSNVKKYNVHRQKIKESLLLLKEKVQEFKLATDDIQSLQIKTIVDLMSIILCATQLLREAIDQSSQGVNSKLNCLDFFLLTHFTEKSVQYNQRYIELITAICQ